MLLTLCSGRTCQTAPCKAIRGYTTNNNINSNSNSNSNNSSNNLINPNEEIELKSLSPMTFSRMARISRAQVSLEGSFSMSKTQNPPKVEGIHRLLQRVSSISHSRPTSTVKIEEIRELDEPQSEQLKEKICEPVPSETIEARSEPHRALLPHVSDLDQQASLIRFQISSATVRLGTMDSIDTYDVTFHPPTSQKPTILISYCRAEAKMYAISLKRKLSKLAKSFHVYLDLDEIHSGIDWQDELNRAIHQCHLFVPLITPTYGATLWTSRELKLADLLGKPIVPVNFGQRWPPESLAIQLATRQFISWKISCNKNPFSYSRDNQLKSPRWSRKNVKRVALELQTFMTRNREQSLLSLSGGSSDSLGSSRLEPFRASVRQAGGGGGGGRRRRRARPQESLSSCASNISQINSSHHSSSQVMNNDICIQVGVAREEPKLAFGMESKSTRRARIKRKLRMFWRRISGRSRVDILA